MKTTAAQWKKTTIGEIADVTAGFGFPLRFQGKKSGKYPFAKVSDMNSPGNEKYISRAENYLDEEDLTKIKAKPFPVGTIIFPKVGAALLTNKRRLLKVETIVDNNIMGLIPKGAASEFIYYWMLNFDVTSHIGNGAVPSINQGYFRNIQILVPPLDEQIEIAKSLQSIDLEIQRASDAYKKARDLKNALMRRLFTKGIGDNKLKKTEIGEVPAQWKVVPIGEVVDFQEGPGILAKDFRDSGTPLVRLEGLTSASLLTGCNYLDPAMVEKKWSHFNLREGDVLLSSSASLGRVAVVDKEAAGAVAYTGIIRFRPKDNQVLARFIRDFLVSNLFSDQISNQETGSTIKHFGPSHLRQIRFVLPSIEEQKSIIEIVTAVENELECYRRYLTNLRRFKKGLSQDLLTGKRRIV